jgi:hypothetical protein
VRRIGVLMASPVTDARYQSLVAAFRQRLQELGWDERSNIQIDYRWAAEDAESIRAYARELVGLRPDVILARSSPEIAALRDETHSIPIDQWLRLQPCASGRQHHRFYEFRISDGWEMAGDAQGDCARRDESEAMAPAWSEGAEGRIARANEASGPDAISPGRRGIKMKVRRP